uniref:Uncharacterized protein n=1 Tax=Strongyloides papillosus TaxID=174720 RepID=A0A0N5C4J6_STREA
MEGEIEPHISIHQVFLILVLKNGILS